MLSEGRLLNLGNATGELTKLSKDQVEYIDVDVEGPYKSDHYHLRSS